MTISPSWVSISTRSPLLSRTAFATSPGIRTARFFPHFPTMTSNTVSSFFSDIPGISCLMVRRVSSSTSPRNSQLREAVAAPLFRAYSVVDEEQPVRIVLLFDFSEARVVAPPIRLLPSLLEVIALANVRARVRNECTKLTHALINALRRFPALRHRWLMSGNSRICGSLRVTCDRQRERGQHCRIRCGVFRPGDRVRRCSSQPLVEVQFET